ncbi:hypothetical protein BX666DRAFT_1983656 [Dichotomocladium elegans]|nr:hypothetical protein BX666DRAFT_1983656 [Dichotomocladium elegans]
MRACVLVLSVQLPLKFPITASAHRNFMLPFAQVKSVEMIFKYQAVLFDFEWFLHFLDRLSLEFKGVGDGAENNETAKRCKCPHEFAAAQKERWAMLSL